VGELTLKAQIEAVLFAAPEPMKAMEILDALGIEGLTVSKVIQVVDELIGFYDGRAGGFHLVHSRGGGFQFQTVPQASGLMERMFSQKPRPLSRAAQETLAIVAYRQPVTRWDIEFIRGVDAGNLLKLLLEKNLIQCLGKKEAPGRPMVFGTTEEFLRVYQLGSLSDLPPIEAFQPSYDVIKKSLSKLDSLDTSEELPI
jgi:segregation and condensation protein B